MKVDKFPYEHFNNFLEKFLRNKEQYVTNITDRVLKTQDTGKIRGLFEKHNEEISKIKGDSKESNEQRKTLNESFRKTIKSLDEPQKCILVHAIWLWALPYKYDAKKALKANQYDLSGITLKKDLWKEHENISSIGSSGSVRMSIIPKILGFFESVWQTNEELTNEKVKDIIKAGIPEKEDPCTTFNAILHFLDPDNVEAIVSSSDKKAIVKAFSSIAGVDYKNIDIDKNIQTIRNAFGTSFNGFYDKDIKPLWRTEIINGEDLSRVQQLKYKKAMVLYGPPGTSKSYTAKALVKQLVFDYYKKNIPSDILKDDYDWKKHYIAKQFHINYTYEDFVGGITIEDGSAKFKKGFIFEAIKKANDLNGTPFVVILDEINRVDVSRVFGEIFTAMELEYRKDGYSLAVPDDKGSVDIKIPMNLYIIGTMNEIDFSLERIDFALRRRFVWNYCGYDKDALIDIIEEKLEERISELNSDDINDFADSCSILNDKIKEHPELGEQYAIGHAFFADIVDIFKESNNWKESQRILWSISIKPTLEAYCGTMDKQDQKNFIESCKSAFGIGK